VGDWDVERLARLEFDLEALKQQLLGSPGTPGLIPEMRTFMQNKVVADAIIADRVVQAAGATQTRDKNLKKFIAIGGLLLAVVDRWEAIWNLVKVVFGH
jgi:hypothetical protein